MTELLAELREARERFMELVAEVRPELHRYCTRMTGSVFDGEDVVQETLAKAYYALAQMESPPPLRPWLFRIAHNTALDFLRRYEHRLVDAVPDLEQVASASGFAEVEPVALDPERVETALRMFAGLPPLQRSALAFKDVLGFSLEETATALDISVAAVKGALVRARANIAAASAAGDGRAPVVDLERLRLYARLFNARDWSALRALFGEETQLEVVSRHQRRGASAAEYFTRYAESAPSEDMHLRAGWVGGVAVLAAFRPAHGPQPAYFIRLDWQGERIARVRDFRYVPYITSDAQFESDAP